MMAEFNLNYLQSKSSVTLCKCFWYFCLSIKLPSFSTLQSLSWNSQADSSSLVLIRAGLSSTPSLAALTVYLTVYLTSSFHTLQSSTLIICNLHITILWQLGMDHVTKRICSILGDPNLDLVSGVLRQLQPLVTVQQNCRPIHSKAAGLVRFSLK